MNIAFYVSSKAGRLRKIIEQGNAELLNNTKLIFSDDTQNQFLKEMVQTYPITYYCFDYALIEETPEKSKNTVMSDELLRMLREHKIDYCFSFGAHILAGDILRADAYRNRIINFHPSVLPMFPGLRAIDQALKADGAVLGNTAHFIDEGIDTGPIIMQNIVHRSIFEKDGYDGILDQQLIMIDKIFKWLQNDEIKILNDRAIVTKANYHQSVFFPD